MSSQDNREAGIDRSAAFGDRIRSLDNFVDKTRLERIASLRKAIVEKNYHVGPVILADKIIDHMLSPSCDAR
jgi:anti-sigma28 factor (negative regulator of flagellin synthesis)